MLIERVAYQAVSVVESPQVFRVPPSGRKEQSR